MYSRKISSPEAEKGFIFILKSKLNLFPPLGSEFILASEDSLMTVKIESYPCTCRGPEKPHEHYYIHWNGLKKNDNIKIVKNGEIYQLITNHQDI